jgi:hypothetical protein
MMIVRSSQRFDSSFRFIGKFGLILLATAFFSLFHFSATTFGSKEKKKIRILFPDQSDFGAYPLTAKGINRQRCSFMKIEFFHQAAFFALQIAVDNLFGYAGTQIGLARPNIMDCHDPFVMRDVLEDIAV